MKIGGVLHHRFFYLKIGQFSHRFHHRFYHRQLSSMFDKIGGIQRFFLKNIYFHVITHLDINCLGLHMDVFMHLTCRHCLHTLICILVGRFFSTLLLIISFIQCSPFFSLYIIIFYWFYVFKTIKNGFS